MGNKLTGATALVLLAAACWFIWAVPGPRMAAALGFGPTTGVVTIKDCYEINQSSDGTGGTENCAGNYVPNGGGAATPVMLHMVSHDYAKGARVPVRMVDGHPYEHSPVDFAAWAMVALVALAVPAGLVVRKRRDFARKRPDFARGRRDFVRERRDASASAGAGGLVLAGVLLALPVFLLLTLVGFVITSLS